MKLRIRNTTFTIKLIGWLQIIGGILGFGLVSWISINIGELNGTILFIILFGYFLFAYSTYSGTKLLNPLTQKLGIVLSIINYCLQLLQFEILGFGLTYASGVSFSIGFLNSSFHFNFSVVSSKFIAAIRSGDDEFKFMINIFAIIILAILFSIWDERTNIEDNKDDFTEEELSTMANTGHTT